MGQFIHESEDDDDEPTKRTNLTNTLFMFSCANYSLAIIIIHIHNGLVDVDEMKWKKKFKNFLRACHHYPGKISDYQSPHQKNCHGQGQVHLKANPSL